MIERNILFINKNHDLKHYVGLSLKTLLSYAVFISTLFSIPAIEWFANKVVAEQIDKGVLGETSITVEIVKNDSERMMGLSGRESIPKNHAMFFIFDDTSYHRIWMKDMKFSLDIVWLNEYAEVIHIEKNISPETFPDSFSPKSPSRYVLEFNAGFVKKNSVKIGDKFVLM